MGTKEKRTYLVTLPNRKISGFSDLTRDEITTAISPDKAVENILFRKASGITNKRTRKIKVMYEFNKFKDEVGDLEKYTHEIETEFNESGKMISRFEDHYKIAQEVFLSEELAEKNRYINSPQNYFGTARNLLSQ